MKSAVLAAILLAACATSAAAQQPSVTVEFDNGQVTLRARNAPVRAILAEWARRGGATIVNGDRLAGPPVTLELVGVQERQALDIVLRNAAGYMLAPRRAGTTGVSAFDRIHILPTSTAPRTPPPAAPPAFGAPRPAAPQPQILRQPPPPVAAVPADDPGADDPADADAAEQPVTGPRPAPPRIVRPAVPPPLGPEPQIVMPDEDDDSEQADAPAQGVAPTPANPFGVPFGSSGRPGVITPVPQQQQPRPPGQQR